MVDHQCFGRPLQLHNRVRLCLTDHGLREQGNALALIDHGSTTVISTWPGIGTVIASVRFGGDRYQKALDFGGKAFSEPFAS